MAQTCENCKYHHIDQKRNTCRRFPPTICVIIVPRPAAIQKDMNQTMMVPSEEARIQFPVVRPEWFCGEWAPALASMQS